MIFSIIRSDATIQDKFMQIISFVVAIVTAIVAHELAHGVAALINGDRTAKEMGRLSINPAAHIDWSGIIMFLIVGIGWAKPVPVNYNNFKKQKLGVITTALAGVLMNFVVGLVSFGVFVGMGAILLNYSGTMAGFFEVIVKFVYFISLFGTLINLALIAFNLLPLFPLDGFRVIEALTPPNNKFVVFMRRYSLYIFIGLIFLGIIPQLDILGMYLGAVRGLILRLFALIFGVNL